MHEHGPVTRLCTAATLAVVTLCGCVTSHVMLGVARPPIPPDQVRIYMQPPSVPFERIAILETSSRDSLAFTAQGKTNAVIARLKAEAAKLGANGVLLQGLADRPGGSVGVGIGNTAYSGNGAFGLGLGTSAVMMQKSGSGLAIYVEPQPPKKP